MSAPDLNQSPGQDGTSIPPEDEDASAEKMAGRARFMQQAIETHRAARAQRLKELNTRASSIAAAIAEYERIDTEDVAEVRIPAGFVRLQEERPASQWESAPYAPLDRRREVATRPPMTRLVNRDSNALSLLLTVHFIAQLEGDAGTNYINRRPNTYVKSGDVQAAWARLAAIEQPSDTLRLSRTRVVRALQALERQKIVAPTLTPSGRKSWEPFRPKSADGSGGPHRVIGDGAHWTTRVAIPIGFFLQGWHLVLDPKEIVTFLAIVEMSYRQRGHVRQSPGDKGIALPIRVRRGWYGLSDEAYETIHTLEEFGLIDILDTMTGRKRGKIKAYADDDKDGSRAPEPYRLIYPAGNEASVYSEPAITRAKQVLTLNTAPTRLTDQLDLARVLRRFNRTE
jgi:hypothetical protein